MSFFQKPQDANAARGGLSWTIGNSPTPQNTMTGQQQTLSNMWGNPTNPQSQQPQGAHPFGAQSATCTFGQTGAPAPFGTTNQPAGSKGFGGFSTANQFGTARSSQGSTGSGLFGTSNTFGAQSTTPTFGQQNTAPAFGQQGTSTGFGQQKTPGFGQQNTSLTAPQPAKPTGFGGALFGQSAQPKPGFANPFSFGTAGSTAPSTGGFGGTASNLFGTSVGPQQPSVGGFAGGLQRPLGIYQAAPVAAAITRETFATEAKLIIQKQEKHFQSNIQEKHASTEGIVRGLEGASLGRIIRESTKSAEENESAFQVLLQEAQNQDATHRKIVEIKKSTTERTGVVKALQASFERKKQSLLYLLQTIEGALASLKNEVEPLYSVFLDSNVSRLIRADSRELPDNSAIEKAANDPSPGYEAYIQSQNLHAKKRLDLYGSIETIFSDVNELFSKLKKLSSALHEKSRSQSGDETQRDTPRTIRRIIDDNFHALSSIWQHVMAFGAKRRALEEIIEKKACMQPIV